MNETSNIPSAEVTSAVKLIRTAILQSQERAVKAVNQEQLALYYGIGRFISANTRNKNWGKGVIESISNQPRQDLPGLRGFGVSSLKNMRVFYEAWSALETNSPITIDENTKNLAIATVELQELTENERIHLLASFSASTWIRNMSTTSCRISFSQWVLPLTRLQMKWNRKYLKYCRQRKN